MVSDPRFVEEQQLGMLPMAPASSHHQQLSITASALSLWWAYSDIMTSSKRLTVLLMLATHHLFDLNSCAWWCKSAQKAVSAKHS